MKLPVSQALYGYWDTLRGSRRAPDRRDLDPVAMRGVLAHTFLLEVDAGDAAARRYPILISGTRIDALFGHPLNGTAFAGLWAPAGRAALSDLLDGVLTQAQPVVAALVGAPEGESDTVFELLLLPLRHEGRTHARLLGSLVPVATPAWIGLRPLTALSLTTWRSLEREGDAPAARGFAVPRSGGLRRDHLVVHEGGRAGAPRPAQPVQARVNRSVRPSRLTPLSTVFHDPAAPARSQT